MDHCNREEWIDIARGLGMILVILGHMDICRILIYSFHMPLFFFLSGYLYKERSFKGLFRYLGGKLLIPYLIWGFSLSVAMYIATVVGLGGGEERICRLETAIEKCCIAGGYESYYQCSASAMVFDSIG